MLWLGALMALAACGGGESLTFGRVDGLAFERDGWDGGG